MLIFNKIDFEVVTFLINKNVRVLINKFMSPTEDNIFRMKCVLSHSL